VLTLKKRAIYVVTLWQERPASAVEPAIWRMTVEDARTGERWNFVNMEALIDFFRQNMEG
jgi:hypothetical protein